MTVQVPKTSVWFVQLAKVPEAGSFCQALQDIAPPGGETLRAHLQTGDRLAVEQTPNFRLIHVKKLAKCFDLGNPTHRIYVPKHRIYLCI